jgi:hypothetical protein
VLALSSELNGTSVIEKVPGRDSRQHLPQREQAKGGANRSRRIEHLDEIRGEVIDQTPAKTTANDDYLDIIGGGVLVLKTLFGRYPFLKRLLADGGDQGPVFEEGHKKAMPGLAAEIIKRSDTAKGFELRTTERDLEKGAVYANLANHGSPIWGCRLIRTANLSNQQW